MSQIGTTSEVPQFGTLETAQTSGDICKICRQPITARYYRANGSMVCGRCADRVRRELPQDSHAAFVRAILFGLVGFAIGLALYAGFVIATGISIGYLALAVGWIIGKLMITGSKGVGGRRYQIAAVALTYAAVSIAFVPIMIYYMRKNHAEHPKAQQQITAQANAGDLTAADAPSSSVANTVPPKKVGFASAVGMLALFGLASPFLTLKAGPSAFIGLIILFVGMQFAWKMTAGRAQARVEGPYELSSAAQA